MALGNWGKGDCLVGSPRDTGVLILVGQAGFWAVSRGCGGCTSLPGIRPITHWFRRHASEVEEG